MGALAASWAWFRRGEREPEEHNLKMLLVPTYVAPSRIAGVGLFAATALPKGSKIWSFTEGVDWRIAPEDLELFPEPYLSRLRHYLYQEQSGAYILCNDGGKFMNHSSTPNCTDKDPRFTMTLRAIAAGEELTCDYREFDYKSREHGLDFPAIDAEIEGLAVGAARNGNGAR